jgi:hypothetical protein
MEYLHHPGLSHNLACKIRFMPHSDSGVCRTVIPGHAAHFPDKLGREKNAG